MSNKMKIWQLSLAVKVTVEMAEVTQESVRSLAFFFQRAVSVEMQLIAANISLK